MLGELGLLSLHGEVVEDDGNGDGAVGFVDDVTWRFVSCLSFAEGREYSLPRAPRVAGVFCWFVSSIGVQFTLLGSSSPFGWGWPTKLQVSGLLFKCEVTAVGVQWSKGASFMAMSN